MTAFCHLHAHSAFSFLDSCSSVRDLVFRAAELGQSALALTDVGSVTGIPRLVKHCAKAGVEPIGGCEVSLDGCRLTLLADGPTGWASLCQVLTAASLRDVKRQGPVAEWADLAAHHDGLVCLTGCAQRGRIPALVRARRYRQAEEYARRLLALFGPGNFNIEVTRTMTEGEHEVSRRLFQLADHLTVPAVATNPVHHATRTGLPAWEVLCRVRLGLAPEEDHPDLPFNGEGFVKSAQAMSRLFADRPDALSNAAALAERLAPPLTPGRCHLPKFDRIPPARAHSPFWPPAPGAARRSDIGSAWATSRAA